MVITGDLNGSTGVVDDKYEENYSTDFEIRPPTSIPLPLRKNCDTTINQQGRSILELCHTFNLKILNGRSSGDPLGNFTYNNANLGTSTIDYSICRQNFYDNVNNFMVLPQNELSDHCKIVTEIKNLMKFENTIEGDYSWEILENNFLWDDNLKSLFSTNLGNNLDKLDDINQRIKAGLVKSTGERIQGFYIQTASKLLNPKQANIERGTKQNKNKGHNKKKWFDTDCNNLKRSKKFPSKCESNAFELHKSQPKKSLYLSCRTKT